MRLLAVTFGVFAILVLTSCGNTNTNACKDQGEWRTTNCAIGR